MTKSETSGTPADTAAASGVLFTFISYNRCVAKNGAIDLARVHKGSRAFIRRAEDGCESGRCGSGARVVSVCGWHEVRMCDSSLPSLTVIYNV